MAGHSSSAELVKTRHGPIIQALHSDVRRHRGGVTELARALVDGNMDADERKRIVRELDEFLQAGMNLRRQIAV